jgi:phosphate transport system substrate-binding protein
MKKISVSLAMLAIVLVFGLAIIGCDLGSSDISSIEGISFENYPHIDGSTSTYPLNVIIAAKLLGLEYEWQFGGVPERNVYLKNSQGTLSWEFIEKLQNSQTHNAIINLIDNKADLIIVARTMSADEKQHASRVGVSLIETPIALDALDFILNSENTLNSLSVEQIQNIYLGNMTNWNEVGGADEAILPFIRNPNSGSQEMMNEIVMGGTGIPNWEVSLFDEDSIIASMIAVYHELRVHPNAICFTPHYYKEYMMEWWSIEGIKTVAVNGIMPSKNSIKNKTYPFVANVYASIRANTSPNSMTYKVYEWLQSKSGKKAIEESGYVPN